LNTITNIDENNGYNKEQITNSNFQVRHKTEDNNIIVTHGKKGKHLHTWASTSAKSENYLKTQM
jgi:hypothetical protein